LRGGGGGPRKLFKKVRGATEVKQKKKKFGKASPPVWGGPSICRRLSGATQRWESTSKGWGGSL